MPTSQNGWPANDISLTSAQLIPGTVRKIRLRTGDAGFLLTRIAAFIDKSVEDIEGGEYDDWGFAERPIRGSSTTLSNHASGTAMDINAVQHPLGVTGTWSAAERTEIHTHLRDYVDPATGDNVIRWGEDYSRRKDGMHFEIVGSYAAVARVAAKLRGKPVPAPSPVVPQDVTISTWAIQFGAGKISGREGDPMRTTDEVWKDNRQFMAWARALGYITKNYELSWVNMTSLTGHIDFAHANLMVAATVRAAQQKNGLVADGYFGSQTGAVMARYGYKIAA